MAFLFGDSFDFYTASGSAGADFTAYGPWTVIGSATYTGASSATTRFGVGKSYYAGTSSYAIMKSGLVTSATTLFCAFAINPAALNGSTTTYYAAVNWLQGSTIQVQIAIRGDGAIEIRRGGTNNIGGSFGAASTLVATFPGAVSAGTWTHLQVKIVLNATTGAVSIRKNGDSADTFGATGLNTVGATGTAVDGFAIGSPFAATSTYWDDLLVWDNSGAAPSDFVGDVRCYALSPTADTTQKDFAPNSGTTNYSRVSETAPDGDTSYVSSSTVGATDLYDLADLATTPTSIVAVTARAVAKKSDAGTRSGAVVVKSGATVAAATGVALSTSYGGLNNTWTTDPNTGAAWTAAAVNALQAGAKVTA